MQYILQTALYLFSFVALYVQVYFLLVFVENRKKLKVHREAIRLFEKDEDYPEVTIVVPAYNEGENVAKTVNSLLDMNYPKDKLFLILVDDGSKDNTWEVMKRYEDNPQIQIFTKENGGKYTAQNLALEHTKTDFLGCLDSDSMVHPEALNRIMTYFLKDNKVMAVAPSIVSSEENTIVQKAQKVEYERQIFIKKMMAFVNAIHVTPGPFSIFKKEVFDKIGPYKHAHMTEDQEIALRMQKNHMKIEHAPDAYVYTNTPKTIKALYKQRTRWIYGFIRNALDYKNMFLKKEYGNIAFINLPISFLLMFSVIFLILSIMRNIYNYIQDKSLIISSIGFENLINTKINIDPFYINTSSLVFISIILYLIALFTLFVSQKIVHNKITINMDLIWFLLIFSVMGPIWLIKSMINAIKNYEASWTEEIDSR